jgi:hypothetical protein
MGDLTFRVYFEKASKDEKKNDINKERIESI